MSTIFTRLVRQTRPSCLTTSTVTYQTIPRAPAFLPRSYATTTKGDQPNAAQNLGTPSPKPSDSPQEGDVKSSRANDGRAPQESGTGLSRPISESTESVRQADEEGGDPTKKDPNKPADQKRAETLKEGEKALDAADQQNTAEEVAKAKEGGRTT